MSQFLIAVLIFTVFIAVSCATMRVPTYQGNVSEHFDGKKFYNPGDNGMGDFKELMRYNRSHKRAKWDFQDSTILHTETIKDFGQNGKVRYYHINHATVLIQMDSINILTDPVFGNRASPLSFAGPKRFREPGIPIELLPRIDVVIISHDHYDHLDMGTLKKLRNRDNPKIFSGLGHKAFLRKFKLYNVTELDWHQSAEYKNLKIIFTPAKHWSNRAFSPRKTLWGSYVIQGSSQLYFAGDTAYGTHFANTREKYGPMDLALIPIGAYIPRSFMLHVHMDPQHAVKAHIDLAAKESYAVHWGTFQLTHEGMFDPIIDLEEACKEARVSSFYFDKYPGLERIFSK
jgi:L-ascorbate metabolism protein UlaG (beta-lactamase superfamily)